MCWYPQTGTYGVSGCRLRLFLLETGMSAQLLCLSMFDSILCFYLFGKTAKRHRTQLHAEEWSIVVLSCHLDPIGDRNDA